ncbi:elongation factor P maturation arginine rhamnosyltransferase EarP [Treponema peruense]|uniref:Protein-arginine rhamnosyltransferase n=1 Tax=Treponema peruense TaxID=2787628 RepID=A0A7T3REJ9_9SPIR|nr:elongation factor P maturation arginine rhamnosyltransferase EarP [Treponema peruense]QQA01609.1 elongation factor P maturation arginine rhamnosyltransferase EarP [Treponema peruense]
MLDITILCRVVDNYGDIGFVYRLARELSSLSSIEKTQIRLIVSDLKSFNAMALPPGISTSLAVQNYNGWKVIDWNACAEGKCEFTEHPPKIILECFQCGRPEWLDEILFSAQTTQTVQIVNVEYLTAEDWADDFHLLKSGTRSALVKKINFMPGFTKKTGGLVLDKNFVSCVHSKTAALECLKKYASKKTVALIEDTNLFRVIAFSYERNFENEARALSEFAKNSGRKVQVLLAPGLGNAPFKKAAAAFKNISVYDLEYLPQLAWDALLTLADFSFIRGEDSFSRACLSGIPFVWHAYPQEEEFQLVKADAVLKRMEPFFSAGNMSLVKNVWLSYNRKPSVKMCDEACKVYNECTDAGYIPLLRILENYGGIKKSFGMFAQSLFANGNLAQKLLAFLQNSVQ